MHLKFGDCCIVHTNLSINGKKKTFPYTKLSKRNNTCEHRLCACAPHARQGSCQICREVFLVDCLL